MFNEFPGSVTNAGVHSSSSYTSSLSAVTGGTGSSRASTPRHQQTGGQPVPAGPLGYTGYHPPQLLPTLNNNNGGGQPAFAARQLAAELDELRRVGQPQAQMTASGYHQPHANMVNNYSSLPRNFHIKKKVR
jgi:hypothetical protein